MWILSLRSNPAGSSGLLHLKTLQRHPIVYCVLTINYNGLHDFDEGEIRELYKSKSNESQRVRRQIGYPLFNAIYG